MDMTKVIFEGTKKGKILMDTFILNWVGHLFFAAVAVLAPIHAVMIVVGVLIFIDLATGLFAALKRKEPISSSAMRRTISKFFVYQIAVVTAFIVETYLLHNILPATKFVSMVIGMVELTSVLENCNTIYGGNLFKSLIKHLGSKNDKMWK